MRGGIVILTLVGFVWVETLAQAEEQPVGMSHSTERLNEGVYALGEAIEHGEKQQTADATEHMMHAIMKLSQSAGLQIPEGVATGKTSTN
ncbi:MAG: hypothetical protein LV473_10590 [Nitrospira sp.]|nr:hypothetical protein [Nitrospira sp.]